MYGHRIMHRCKQGSEGRLERTKIAVASQRSKAIKWGILMTKSTLIFSVTFNSPITTTDSKLFRELTAAFQWVTHYFNMMATLNSAGRILRKNAITRKIMGVDNRSGKSIIGTTLQVFQTQLVHNRDYARLRTTLTPSTSSSLN